MKGLFDRLMQLYTTALGFLVVFCITVVLAARFSWMLGKLALLMGLAIVLRVVWTRTRGF